MHKINFKFQLTHAADPCYIPGGNKNIETYDTNSNEKNKTKECQNILYFLTTFEVVSGYNIRFIYVNKPNQV